MFFRPFTQRERGFGLPTSRFPASPRAHPFYPQHKGIEDGTKKKTISSHCHNTQVNPNQTISLHSLYSHSTHLNQNSNSSSPSPLLPPPLHLLPSSNPHSPHQINLPNSRHPHRSPPALSPNSDPKPNPNSISNLVRSTDHPIRFWGILARTMVEPCCV